MINTKMLAQIAIDLRFELSFLVKLDTFNSSNEIYAVSAANKNRIKKIK